MKKLCRDTDSLRQRIMRLLKQAPSARGAYSSSRRGRKGLKEYPTAFGRNIDRLRLECGWSYDDLARASGLDKYTILLHVNKGMQPRPATMKIYADTFSRALERTISVSDLQA